LLEDLFHTKGESGWRLLARLADVGFDDRGVDVGVRQARHEGAATAVDHLRVAGEDRLRAARDAGDAVACDNDS
jgi:hypothetical protein